METLDSLKNKTSGHVLASEHHHEPVLVKKILQIIPPETQFFADFTLGLAGHSTAILNQHINAQLYGFDRDALSLKIAQKKLTNYVGRFTLFHQTFADALEQHRNLLAKCQFFLADLGVSSYQLLAPERGFSLQHSGPLDMRMNTQTGQSALEFLQQTDEQTLVSVLQKYGEEPYAKKIAKHVINAVRLNQITTTESLKILIEKLIPYHYRKKKHIHPATLTFQALRIKVNSELEQLEFFLQKIPTIAQAGSVLAVISFHSLEDRIVKKTFQHWAKDCVCSTDMPICRCTKRKTAKIIFNKAQKVTEEEYKSNPKSRSARLRAVVFQ